MRPERLAEHILDASAEQYRHPGMIRLVREHCGVWKVVDRVPGADPESSVVALTNECPRCLAAAGGYGSTTYFDAESNELGAGE